MSETFLNEVYQSYPQLARCDANENVILSDLRRVNASATLEGFKRLLSDNPAYLLRLAHRRSIYDWNEKKEDDFPLHSLKAALVVRDKAITAISSYVQKLEVGGWGDAAQKIIREHVARFLVKDEVVASAIYDYEEEQWNKEHPNRVPLEIEPERL